MNVQLVERWHWENEEKQQQKKRMKRERLTTERGWWEREREREREREKDRQRKRETERDKNLANVQKMMWSVEMEWDEVRKKKEYNCMKTIYEGPTISFQTFFSYGHFYW